MIPRHVLFLCLLLPSLTPLVVAQKPASAVQTTSEGGAQTTVFKTKPGLIRVTLPDDIVAGDTISGTVTAEPNGVNEKEKERNASELTGYVVELENQKSPLSGGVIRRIHIAAETSAPLLILLDAKGKQIGVIPITLQPPATPVSSMFSLPTLGQTGRLIQIQGPFDGDPANTSVKVGGTHAKTVAESPRKLVIESPRDVVGPTEIKVTENGTATTGRFRNLKIDLTAPKTSLLKGESTELHVQVSGLQGITEPVPVRLQNQSPSTVNITGGNTQNIIIQPSQVMTGGVFNWSAGLTGAQSGGFNITATLSTSSGSRTQTLGP